MEETNTTPPANAPAGKGLGIAGFVISLVGLVLYFVIGGIVTAQIVAATMKIAVGETASVGYGLTGFWLVVCIVGLVLSIMGMVKLGKTGGKRGLAITGMILGIIAVILTFLLLIGIMRANEELAKSQSTLQGLGTEIKESIQQAADSIQTEIEKGAAADSTAHQ